MIVIHSLLKTLACTRNLTFMTSVTVSQQVNLIVLLSLISLSLLLRENYIFFNGWPFMTWFLYINLVYFLPLHNKTFISVVANHLQLCRCSMLVYVHTLWVSMSLTWNFQLLVIPVSCPCHCLADSYLPFCS
jgi:hypothetical protein